MNRIKYLLTAAATVALIGACTEDIGNEGPQLEDLYGDFRLVTGLETSADDVNFSAGEKMYFTAAFNKSTDWEIHLKGQTSGAEKVITGKSPMLDQSNATWDGSTTIFPMFREEQVAVSLVVPEGSLEMMDTVNVLGTKINDGLIVADFESGLNPGWEVFKQSGARMKFEIKNDSAAQGQACYDLAGEVNWDWLIGYLYLPASALPDTVLNGGTTYPLSSNPNQVYLNLLVYSPAEYNNELLLIRINEDDNLNGSHDGSNEDQWSAQIREVAAGWNQISLRYADFVTLVNGAPSNPAGNGVHEPEKINKIELLMLADPNSGYSRLLIDYIIFTEGGPFEP